MTDGNVGQVNVKRAIDKGNNGSSRNISFSEELEKLAHEFLRGLNAKPES